MNSANFMLVLVSIMIFAHSSSGKDKIDIETIKKVDDCTYRSKLGDTLTWHFTGKLSDGTVFDSSRDRNPYSATLRPGKIVGGIDGHYGMLDMCIGEIRTLTIPPSMGYGDEGHKEQDIPPKATIIFTNELLKIVKAGAGEL